MKLTTLKKELRVHRAKNRSIWISLFGALLLFLPPKDGVSGVTSTPNCEFTIDRVPCPGHENAALKPYKTPENPNGNPTIETSTFQSVDDCIDAGKMKTPILRSRTLATKTVKIKFNGKNVGEFTDKRRCGQSMEMN